tara:strand:- start:342 stop:1073 length:732 start_codon:yes stop_codon:yes gene_type:complete
MNSDKALDIEQVKVENLIYNEIRSVDNKLLIPIKYKEKSKIKDFIIQTPSFLNIKLLNVKKKYIELYIPLEGKKEKKINSFTDLIENIEKKIIYDAHINSSSWFKNKSNQKLSSEPNGKYSYRKIIKRSIPNLHNKNVDNNNYNKFIKLKIYDDKLSKSIINYNDKNIKLDEMPDRTWIKIIIQFNSLIIKNNYFEIFLKPLLILLTPYDNLIVESRIIKNKLDINLSDNDNLSEESSEYLVF